MSLKRRLFGLLSTAISKEIFQNFKKIRKSKDLWIAIANLCEGCNEQKKTEKNDLKDQIDELNVEILRLSRIRDEIDLLKEENVRLKKEVNEFKMKSELRELQTDDDKDVSVVTESPSTVADKDGFCVKEESKSKSKPVECQKSKVKTKKKKRNQRRRSRKSKNKKSLIEKVDIMNLLTKAFNDHIRVGVIQSQRVNRPQVFHSRHSFQIFEKKTF